MDWGYVSGKTLAQARDEGRELLGPARPSFSAESRIQGCPQCPPRIRIRGDACSRSTDANDLDICPGIVRIDPQILPKNHNSRADSNALKQEVKASAEACKKEEV